jgi:ABC-type glycerol-3-phosphate transport system permease component
MTEAGSITLAEAAGRRRSIPALRNGLVWLAVYAVLIAAVVVLVFPVFWMVSTSLKPRHEMFARAITMLPKTWTLQNYINVWTQTDFAIYFWNSFKVATISTLLALVVSIYAAYAMARIRFPGRDAFGIALLVTQMFPGILFVIPLFRIIKALGLFDTQYALIIAYVAYSLPFGIWMMRSFFAAIPTELEDAAAVDGASMIGTLHRVILPLAGPGIAAVTMYNFIRSWNEFLFALVFLQSNRLFTLPLGLAAFEGDYSFRWDLLMAGASSVSLPILVVFLVMNRFIVQGMLGGAVKG